LKDFSNFYYKILSRLGLGLSCALFFLTITLNAQSSVSSYENGSVYHYSQFITKADIKKHITLLASDSLEGRAFGTKGAFKASEYIASQLRYENINAKGDRGTYFQPMVITKWMREKSDFHILNQSGSTKFEMVSGKDFTYNIADLGTTTNLSGDHLMFAGFGIMDEKYNDYQYAQVRNEVVMFLEGEPSKDGKYIISGTNQPGKWSKDLKAKIEVAVQKGARAVFILVDSTRFAYRTKEQLATNIIYKDVLKQNYPIPVIRINKNALAQMLLPREYKRINKYISNAQKGKISSNYISSFFKVNLVSSSTQIRDRNVVASIEGTDPELKNEYIVVSAHYDHIGIINGEIYNGADDNGTGTSALLTLAKAMKALQDNKFVFKRSVLFLFCTGEEVGLIGSKYYTENPIVPLKDTKIEINIDMIGRNDEDHEANENYVYVIGSDKINPLLDRVIRENNSRSVNYKLDYTYNDLNHPLRLYYRSDHYNFAELGIPSVFFFGGFHKDYHQATDDTYLINTTKVEDITKLVYFTVIDLANQPGEILTKYKSN